MEQDIYAHLVAIVGPECVITEPTQQLPYLSDWRGRYFGEALAVVKPQQTSQIVELVKLCHAHNISIIPQGGNTSLCGGATPLAQSTRRQLVINLSLMNKVLAIDTENNSITAEAGCTLSQIIEQAESNNRYFPLNIAAAGSCQIGGNIATNAGGVHVVKYGMMRDMVLGLEVVLANGTILNQLNSLRKNNTYLDLKQLFIGSEGTLGIITKAVLKLYPQPIQYTTGLIGVKTIAHATWLLNQLSTHFSLCAFEVISRTTQEIYNNAFNTHKFPISDDWVILFELETDDSDKAIDTIATYELDTEQIIISDNLTTREGLWRMRENIPMAEKLHGIAIKHDISLPISKIEQFIGINQENIRKVYPEAQIIIFGHLGDGNLHYNIQLVAAETLTHTENINKIVYGDVLRLGGSISAEHGIGQLKMAWYKNSADPVGYNLAKQIKQQLDPDNLFNPAKVLFAPADLGIGI